MARVPTAAGGNIFISVPLDGVFAALLFLGVCRGIWRPGTMCAVGGKLVFTYATGTTHGWGDFSGCDTPPIEFLPLSTMLPRGSPTSDYLANFPSRT